MSVAKQHGKSNSAKCAELAPSLRSKCEGPGVTCTTQSDAHSRWEAVLGTEPTLERDVPLTGNKKKYYN